MKTSKSKKVSADEVMETINTMRKKDRDELIGKLFDMEEYREDIIDAMLIESQKDEELIPFRDCLKDWGIKR